MNMMAAAFYLFASITVFSGFMVISARNPVHSVLWLILAFFNAAGLFLLLGAEFLAMLLVIVYVGAVAVLFLFVVMMLDINFAELRQGFLQYLPVGVTIAAILVLELGFYVFSATIAPDLVAATANPMPDASAVTNTEALGLLLYTNYDFIFQSAGMVLLVAMIGAIVLTHRRRPGVKKQDISAQLARRRADAFEIRTVKTGAGLDAGSGN